MELLVHRLKPATQAYVNGITSVLCVLICGIVAYYGNPLSKRMGVLGEYSNEEMLRRPF
jgi:TRAP-type C4-dicarboxylate transport system permease small subunit